MPAPRQPLVIAHHLMWTLYGWWLPNDPRGSTSRAIRNDLLAELGALHFGRRAGQPAGRDIREFYTTAQEAIAYPLLRFAPNEFAAVGGALGEVIRERNYTCYACAVMPDHVHLLIRKHRDAAEEMIEHLQLGSRLRLSASNLRTTDHPTWTRGGWKVFLDHPDDVRRTIRYIEDTPVQWRLPKQEWEFVDPYDGWPLHAGHSANSPYVRALRAAGRYPR